MRELWRGRVPAGHPVTTVGRWLAREAGLSVTLLRRLKAAGGIRVNGQVRRTVDPLVAGDEVVLSLAPAWPPHVDPEPIPLDVVLEDDDVIVLNKPPGLVVHPTRGTYAGTVANGLAHHWQRHSASCGFHPVHRLDRDTSGLLLLAKHPLAHQRLDEQLQARSLTRAYHAVAWGQPEAEAGTIALPIGHPDAASPARAVMVGGQPAVTRWEVLERLSLPRPSGACVLRLVLETGRTHQIRVHLAALGHPLLGDALYAPARSAWAPRQALHAAELGFRHPRSGGWCQLHAPWPPDLRAALRRLGAAGG